MSDALAEAHVRALAERVARVRETRGADARVLVAIAGAPGSGKSTLAAVLAGRLDASVVVPMDGFHLDDALLGPAGLLPVKGAPHTFDVGGLDATLARVRRDAGPVYVPVFDRDVELSRAAAAVVEPDHRTVLVEGNYLLLDREPWSALREHFDVSVLLDVPEPVLRERLVGRWLDQGLEPAAARARAESNDLPNGALVREASVAPDLRLAPPPSDV